MHLTRLLLIVCCLAALASCKSFQGKPERKASLGSIFEKTNYNGSDDYDLSTILRGGELVIATISDPDIYYEDRGVALGHHYLLAENFANEQGLAIRVEVASDTAALVQILRDGDADIAVYPLDDRHIERAGLAPAGYNLKGHWAVRRGATELAEVLNSWYGDGVEINIERVLQEKMQKSHHIDRKAQAMFLSRDQGVISVYDDLFKRASQTTGWDWRLIAAQCYQESCFDPNARSYAGAKGLMQLMPRTAASLGLQPEEITMPAKNVDAAARYIVKLSEQFRDIPNALERTKFVLASYNGGSGHVRDAMALARKYGHDAHQWEQVAPYILGLSQSKYYKDPVVKYGYMIGRETAGYVQKIMERWHTYGGNVVVGAAPKLPSEAEGPKVAPATQPNTSAPATPQRKNRYSSGQRVLRPDEPGGASGEE